MGNNTWAPAFLRPRPPTRVTVDLDWIIINSNKVTCLTYDDLYTQLHEKLELLQKLAAGV
jgi:hypothetical protein